MDKKHLIIINGRFLTHRTTGVERYAREIISELDKIVSPGEVEMAVPVGACDIPKYHNIRVVKVGRLKNVLWEHISFPLYVARRKGISLNLCNTAPLLFPGIVCIHDMKIKAVPQFFDKKFLVWYKLLFFNAAKRAKVIITVSEFSESEIIKYYKVDAGKIHVIPNAWQHFGRVEYDEKTLEKYGLTLNEYYFAMCSLEPNKNFRWIAETACAYPERMFAVAGAVNRKVFSEGLGFACPKNMMLLGYVSDEEAKTLMRDCRAFLFPTFYEGFGIPPLEALSAGAKQVMVSDTLVMHEIYGASVTYIDPHKACEGLDVTEDSRIDASNVFERFSWADSARKLFDVLNRHL